MLTEERQRIILDLLKQKEVVRIQDLVEELHSSESTIRRDLSFLEEQKQLKRVHGGAALLHQKGEELDMDAKSTRNQSEKQMIAAHAAQLVKDGDCIFLDAGTTTYLMIPFLQAKNITVVTNGLSHLEALAEKQLDCYLTGGFIKWKTKALIGRRASDSLKEYRFDKSFIGVNGVHPEYGFTTPDPEEANIKKLATHLAQQVYVLCDHSKFHEVTFSKITDLHAATIITNESEEDILGDYQQKTNVITVSN
ncbi:DeoR/GlpR family DNA-binding transcription regulator [Radiobacillus kanasensis]|uniref:DeoR/GlpR family DNA-binding transcription regulator n=1 Tax=Radiobacillus kanasensis TaxID=2844358 RepID=UPI001E47F640|nr:DeoR/GlpR family DNA-binding transcription regulator [Radiobacillus kanasensis]UFT98627.1 DeoR/GlpR family DNA-binding transcription regulator [Radiobacillus kanasensis]